MDEETRKYLDAKFDAIHERITGLKDDHAEDFKQVAVDLTKIDGKVLGHEKEIAGLQDKAWMGVTGFISALIMAIWQLLTMKFGGK